tara:strand:- start:2053 stop:2895 length:843 start_codon:yes stop_codon:yes gene_type:complete
MTQSGSTKVYASLLYYLKKYKNPNTLGFHDGDLPWPICIFDKIDEWPGNPADITNFLKYLNTAPIVIKSHDCWETCRTQFLLPYMDCVRFIFLGCLRDPRDALCSWARKSGHDLDDPEAVNSFLRKQADFQLKWDIKFIDRQALVLREECQWKQYLQPSNCTVVYEDYQENNNAFAKMIYKIGNLSDNKTEKITQKISDDIIKFFNVDLLEMAKTNKNEFLLTSAHITNGGQIGGYKEFLTTENSNKVKEQYIGHLEDMKEFYNSHHMPVRHLFTPGNEE